MATETILNRKALRDFHILERYDGAPCTDIEALLRADMTARGVASGIMESMSTARVQR